MELKVSLEVNDGDVNMLINLLGHAFRATTPEEYQKVVPYVKEAAQGLVTSAFEAGREFQRKNPDK